MSIFLDTEVTGKTAVDASIDILNNAVESIRKSENQLFTIPSKEGNILLSLEDKAFHKDSEDQDQSYWDIMKKVIFKESFFFRVVYAEDPELINKSMRLDFSEVEPLDPKDRKEKGMLKEGDVVVPVMSSNQSYSITSQSNGYIGEVVSISETGKSILVKTLETSKGKVTDESLAGFYTVSSNHFVPISSVGNILYKDVVILSGLVISDKHRDSGLTFGTVIKALDTGEKIDYKGIALEKGVDVLMSEDVHY